MRFTMQRGVILFAILTFLVLLPVAAGESAGLIAERVAGSTQLSVADEASFHSTPNEIGNQRLIELPDSGTRLALWNETDAVGMTMPWYAIGPSGEPMGEGRQTSYRLKVLHGEFDPLTDLPRIEEGLAASTDTNLYLVQFVTQSLEEYRQTIERLGGSVQGFMPHHTNVVRMSPEVRTEVERLAFVRWVGPFHPAYRIESFLLDLRQYEANSFPTQRYNILVYKAGDAGKPVVATQNGGPRDFVSHAEDGFLVFDNPQSICWGVNTIFGNFEHARWMGSQGRVKAAYGFSWDAITRQTEAVYEELVCG